MPNTSEQQAARATTHGIYAGDRRLTAELCRNLRRHALRELEADGVFNGYDLRYSPPLICDEWLDDLAVMVDDVVASAGLRPSRDYILAPFFPELSMCKTNVEWVLRPERKTRRATKKAPIAR